MKKNLWMGIVSLALFTACSVNEELERSQMKALSFDTFVSKGTRAVPKESFEVGDDFGVAAYVHTDEWAVGGSTAPDLLMGNQKVAKTAKGWEYAPLCYWDEERKHTFLAYSPHNANYRISNYEIESVQVASKTADQVDLLYSLPEIGSKDLEWKESQKVLLTFRHALSQVKFSIQTDQDYSGYYAAKVTGIRVKGVSNIGKLNLNVANNTTSPWTVMGYSENYHAETGVLDVGVSENLTNVNTGENVFMLLPQTLAEDAAYFEFVYDITPTPAGETKYAGTGKVFTIKVPAVTWKHNSIYHYHINMNLQQLLGLSPIEVGEPEIVEWETGLTAKLPEDLTVIIPGSNGDTPQNGTGETTLGFTKDNAGSQVQEIKIVNPEKSDQWIAEVGPEITSAVTRAEEKPADWIKIARDNAAGTGAIKLYGTNDESVYIKITGENTTLQPRKAEVLIKRALTGTTRIVVTQTAADAAVIEANTTQFGIGGGANQFTVKSESNTNWTLEKSTDADWLKLNTNSDGAGTEVTGGNKGEMPVFAIATPNTTTAVRKATITLTQDTQTPVTVEVTQAVARPMMLSSSSLMFVHSSGSKTFTITNPEYNVSGFGWTLEKSAGVDWVTIGTAAGTGNVTNVTITAAANNTRAVRSATLTLKRAGQANISINVMQDAPGVATAFFSGSGSTKIAATGVNAAFFTVQNPAPQFGWTFSSNNSSWVKIGKSASPTGTSVNGTGNAQIYLKAEPNTTINARNETLTFSCTEQANSTFTVTQAAAGAATLSMTSKAFEDAGGGVSLTITNPATSSEWTLNSSDPTWLTVSQTSGTGKATVTVTAKDNRLAPPNKPRSGVITLKRDGQSDVKLNVTQEGAEPITFRKHVIGGLTYNDDFTVFTTINNGYNGGAVAYLHIDNPAPKYEFTVTADDWIRVRHSKIAIQFYPISPSDVARTGKITFKRAYMKDVVITLKTTPVP